MLDSSQKHEKESCQKVTIRKRVLNEDPTVDKHKTKNTIFSPHVRQHLEFCACLDARIKLPLYFCRRHANI